MIHLRIALGAMLAVLCGCGSRHHEGRYQPLSPEKALLSFRLSEDFRIELVACEPLVIDPVEIVFDENGKMYVAEMLDYPEDPQRGKPARSRIVILEDTNNDGRVDKRTVFAEPVLQVSGLQPWRGGLIVTSAPDILFLKDTDGDGRADLRKVLYTGFPRRNPESRITNPRLAIDNWVYASNSGAEGQVTAPDHPELPAVLVRGADFRFRPDGGPAEPASGPAQFGSTFDDWGNRFITQNTIHLRHVVLPMHYLKRNSYLTVSQVVLDISDHGQPSAPVFPLTKPQLWREQRTALRQKRYEERGLSKVEQVGGYFTAATGGTVYTGDSFPSEYVGSIFTGDVNGNLVHRDILTPDGVTFSAHRAREGVEFLASTDIWFRPCNFANAPDGNLYIADIYREFVETPESIPEEIKKHMDFWSGDDKGRIYRIVPNKPRRKGDLKPNLGSASTTELVRHLANPNGWHRQTAQRLLLERQDRVAVPLLEEMTAKHDLPLARVHALWTLEGISPLTPPVVERALRDAHPAVREHALRLAEPFLGKSKSLVTAVLAMRKDPDTRVQFQLAFTIGGLRHDPRALGALADLAAAHSEDRWFRAAVLSSVPDSAFQLFQSLYSRAQGRVGVELLSQLGSVIGARHDAAEVTRYVQVLAGRRSPDADSRRAAGLNGLARGFRTAAVTGLKAPALEPVLARLLDSPSANVQSATRAVAQHFELKALLHKAAHDALSPALPVSARAGAIRLLRGGAFSAAGPVLRKFIDPKEPPELQTAAIETLAGFDDPSIGPLLLDNWRSYSPEVRTKALQALLGHRGRVPLVLKALEEGRVERAALDFGARDRLLENPDPAVRERARRMLRRDAGDRAKVVESYRSIVTMAADASRGKQVFEKNCGKCHTPQRRRDRIGPDLSGVNNKTKEELLVSILNPSAEIEPRYTNYIVVTREGRMYDGVIVSETPSALMLRADSDDADVAILRRNIAEIRASSVSLMPDELEKQMNRQEIADVIAYLRAGL